MLNFMLLFHFRAKFMNYWNSANLLFRNSSSVCYNLLKKCLFPLIWFGLSFFLVVWPLFEPLTFDPISGQKPPDCHSLGQGQPMAVIAPGQHEFDGHRSLPRGNRPMRSFTSPNPHNQSNLFSGVHHHSTPKHQIGKVGQDIMVKSRLFSSESFAKESHLVLFLD